MMKGPLRTKQKRECLFDANLRPSNFIIHPSSFNLLSHSARAVHAVIDLREDIVAQFQIR